jgi:hypothetical protein
LLFFHFSRYSQSLDQSNPSHPTTASPIIAQATAFTKTNTANARKLPQELTQNAKQKQRIQANTLTANAACANALALAMTLGKR